MGLVFCLVILEIACCFSPLRQISLAEKFLILFRTVTITNRSCRLCGLSDVDLLGEDCPLLQSYQISPQNLSHLYSTVKSISDEPKLGSTKLRRGILLDTGIHTCVKCFCFSHLSEVEKGCTIHPGIGIQTAIKSLSHISARRAPSFMKHVVHIQIRSDIRDFISKHPS